MTQSQELFLQNALAQAASLLHQTVTLLNKNPTPGQLCLIIEIQAYFSETRESLSLMLAQAAKPQKRDSSGFAPIAQSPGLGWKEQLPTQEKTPGTLSPGPVWNIPPRPTPTSLEAEAYYPTCYGIPKDLTSEQNKTSSNPFLEN